MGLPALLSGPSVAARRRGARGFRWWALALLWPWDPVGANAGDHQIGDYTVVVEADGAFSVWRNGGRLVATTSAPYLRAERFSVGVVETFGLFDFVRRDRNGFAFDRLDGEESESGTLRLRLTSSARPGAMAELVFEPAGSDRLRVNVSRSGAGKPRGFRLDFEMEAGAHFLGFGEQYDHVDHTGHRVPIWVSEQGLGRSEAPLLPWVGGPHETYYPVPAFVDPARRMGFLLDADERSVFDLGESDPARWHLEVWETSGFGMELAAGTEPLDVVEDLSEAMGRPALPPDWAFGVWLAAEGGQERVREVMEAIAEERMAITSLWVQDWVGRRDIPVIQQLQYTWKTDTSLYPDLPGLIDEAHAQNLRFLGYINGFLVPQYANYWDAVRGGHTIRGGALGLAPYTMLHSTFTVTMVDFTSTEATRWFQEFVHGMVDLGMDGFMADYGEWLPWDATLAEGRAPGSHNRFPEYFQRACREVLEERLGGDYVMFSRSGYTGAQDAQQIVWAGDQECQWGGLDGLRTVPRAGISAGLSGIPFWTHDLGGYSGGPREKELFLRWAELAAFTPFMRTHEGSLRSANWQWDSDEDTRARFARLTRIHRGVSDAVLRPLAPAAAATGRPLVRHLALHYPDDPRVLEVEDEFLLGRDLLVAPILDPGVTSRWVYLPAGEWILVWDRSRWPGGTEHLVSAPLGEPPVFVRRGGALRFPGAEALWERASRAVTAGD